MGDRLLTVTVGGNCIRMPKVPTFWPWMMELSVQSSMAASQTPTPKGSRVSAAKVRHRTLEEFMNSTREKEE